MSVIARIELSWWNCLARLGCQCHYGVHYCKVDSSHDIFCEFGVFFLIPFELFGYFQDASQGVVASIQCVDFWVNVSSTVMRYSTATLTHNSMTVRL